MSEIGHLKWIHSVFHSQGWLNYIMEGITYVGEFGLSVMVCAVILFIIKKTCVAGFDMAVGIIFNLLIVNVILKIAVNRARPWTEYEGFIDFYKQFGIRQPTDSSFPSGHTAICFCGAVSLLFSYKAKGVPAIVVAVLVALSRIYLCLHYPTDVLGGALIGTACGIGGHYAAKGILAFMQKKFPRFTEKLFGLPQTPKEATEEAAEAENAQNELIEAANAQNELIEAKNNMQNEPTAEPEPQGNESEPTAEPKARNTADGQAPTDRPQPPDVV